MNPFYTDPLLQKKAIDVARQADPVQMGAGVVAGIPGQAMDMVELLKTLAEIKQGNPTSLFLDQPAQVGTTYYFGEAMGADPSDPNFQIGSMFSPGPGTKVKAAGVGALKGLANVLADPGVMTAMAGASRVGKGKASKIGKIPDDGHLGVNYGSTHQSPLYDALEQDDEMIDVLKESIPYAIAEGGVDWDNIDDVQRALRDYSAEMFDEGRIGAGELISRFSDSPESSAQVARLAKAQVYGDPVPLDEAWQSYDSLFQQALDGRRPAATNPTGQQNVARTAVPDRAAQLKDGPFAYRLIDNLTQGMTDEPLSMDNLALLDDYLQGYGGASSMDQPTMRRILEQAIGEYGLGKKKMKGS